MKKALLITLIIGIIAALAMVSVRYKQKRIFTDSRITMDTVVSVSVVSSSREKARAGFERVFSELDTMTGILNFYSEMSEIGRINKHAGAKPVEVSAEAFDIIQKALAVAAKTNGAFDPTTGVLTALWDFPQNIKPEDRDVRAKVPLVSYKEVALNEEKRTVFLKKKEMMIDLGGIAKGYAADRVVEMLTTLGFEAALVSVAGDIRAYGLKPDGAPWRVGIKDPRPRNTADTILAALPLADRAISTSGDYQRYFEIEGVRYHHILDPKTGMPARGCQSVSVLAEAGYLADSVATAVFVAGPKKGPELLKSLGYEGVIVDADGGVFVTEGLEKDIELARRGR